MGKPVKLTLRDLPPQAARPNDPHNPIYLVLDNVRSAFNVGSAFRTADAAYIEKLYLCGISAYPPNPKLEKTALGSTQIVPWKYCKTTLQAVEELKAQNIPICLIELATDSTGLWEYRFPKPVALVFGHEVYGVSEEIFPLADAVVYIPMYGNKATLNVSTALGVALFEALRQWHNVGI